MKKVFLIGVVAAALVAACDSQPSPVGPGTTPPADGGGEPKPDVDKQ